MPSLFCGKAVFAVGDAELGLPSFRLHRHDVMNVLQVVRGYIQLNRPTDAIAAVDGLAAWLKSLSYIQAISTLDARLLWTASHCPHVILMDAGGTDALTDDEDMGLSTVWKWLDEQMTLQGLKLVQVRLQAAPPAPRGVTSVPRASERRISVLVKSTPEISEWWENEGHGTAPRGEIDISLANG